MFDYTSNDARVIIWTSSVQTDTCEWKPHIFACESGWLKWQKPCSSWPGAVFFSVKVTCCASVKSEYGCLVTKYFKQKLHESQNSNLCFMSNSTTVIYMHLGFHGKATVMVFIWLAAVCDSSNQLRRKAHLSSICLERTMNKGLMKNLWLGEFHSFCCNAAVLCACLNQLSNRCLQIRRISQTAVY